jgi:hypothetical protein
MLPSEGFVTSVTDGKAKVVIHTDQPGIPGAPELNVCDHCSECTAKITVDVSNIAGALVGDRVSVAHKPGILKKNVWNLLGIPLSGLLFGLAAGFALDQLMAISLIGVALLAAAGLVPGMIIGIRIQSRIQDDSLPFISRILETGTAAEEFQSPAACRDSV